MCQRQTASQHNSIIEKIHHHQHQPFLSSFFKHQIVPNSWLFRDEYFFWSRVNDCMSHLVHTIDAICPHRIHIELAEYGRQINQFFCCVLIGTDSGPIKAWRILPNTQWPTCVLSMQMQAMGFGGYNGIVFVCVLYNRNVAKKPWKEVMFANPII